MREAAIDTHRSTARGARSRTGGAPPLDDLIGEGPIGRNAPRRGGVSSAAIAAQRLGGGRSAGRAAQSRREKRFSTMVRARLPRIRPLKALTIAAFGVALVGIVANAMIFQRGHRPAPLFGLGHTIDGASDAAQRTAAALPPPAPPVPAEKTGTIPTPLSAAAVPAAPAEPAQPVVAAPKATPEHHAPKIHHEESAKPKAEGVATATAHPRPGHPAVAKAEHRSAAKVDPVAQLLAGEPHTAATDVKAKPVAKPPVKAEAKATAPAEPARAAKAAAVAPAAHLHHHVAEKASAETAKPAAQTD